MLMIQAFKTSSKTIRQHACVPLTKRSQDLLFALFLHYKIALSVVKKEHCVYMHDSHAQFSKSYIMHVNFLLARAFIMLCAC